MRTRRRRRPTLEPLESKALLSTGASAQAAVGLETTLSSVDLSANYRGAVILPAAGADTEGSVDVTGWGTTRESGSLADILQTTP